MVREAKEPMTTVPSLPAEAPTHRVPRSANAHDVREQRHFETLTPAGTREQAELQTLTAAGDAFGALFESAGEALVITDSTGVIQRANTRAQHLLGLGEGNARGVNLGTVLAEKSGAGLLLLCDAAEPAKCAALDAALVTGDPIQITLRAILPESHALLLCVEEKSGSETEHSRLRQADAEVRSVVESVPVGILVFDPAGRVRLSNTRVAEVLGMKDGCLRQAKTADDLARSLAARVHNPDKFRATWAGFRHGQHNTQIDELEISRPERRVIQRLSRPVLNDSRVSGWIEIYTDVTAEKQMQSKILQTEKMAAVGQLVSGIAHELNNPLTTIMGYIQLLLGHGLTAGQVSEARKVYHEAERARRIVKNLLYFARQNKPERTRVNINEIIERTVALRSYELKVENITVDCELARDLPITMADPYQLQQVVLNLLINAEQALVESRGRGRVWIRTRRATRQSAERIVVEVVDDGPGVPPEISNRLFDPFFTTKPPGIGTGLGLSIVYGIVDKHGGEVSLERESGRGAKFVVELPTVKPPKEPVRQIPPPRLTSDRVTGRHHILAIEDEPTVADLIVDVLREVGHRVEAVLDSTEGLARLSRGAYDLVICDLRMPGLDGPAFYDALVRAGSPMQNRILFITGDTLSPRTLEFLEPRKLPYLAKPFLVEELKLAVHNLLRMIESEPEPIRPAHRKRA